MYKRQPRILFVDCAPGRIVDEVTRAASEYAEDLFEWKELRLDCINRGVCDACKESLNWADLIVLLEAGTSALEEHIPATAQLRCWYDSFSGVDSVENLRQSAAFRVRGLAGGIRMLSRTDS